MITEYAIEKDVPIPALQGRGSGKGKYPFTKMQIGESFFVSCENDDRKRIAINIMGSARRFKGMLFTTRRIDGGVRCWRLE